MRLKPELDVRDRVGGGRPYPPAGAAHVIAWFGCNVRILRASRLGGRGRPPLHNRFLTLFSLEKCNNCALTRIHAKSVAVDGGQNCVLESAMHASRAQKLGCSPLRDRYQEISNQTLELTR